MSRTQSRPATVNGAEGASPLTLSSVTDSAAWIVQGVSPEDERNRMCEEGDAVWYARTVNELLTEAANDWDTQLDDHMKDIVCSVVDRYSAEVDDLVDLDLATLPSAMITCIRWDENNSGEVEYFNLGDSVALLDLGSGQHRVCATDGSLHESEFDSENQWRLAFSPDAVDFARHGVLEDHDVHTAHLYPTAVDAAVEVYDMFDDTTAFLGALNSTDPDSLVERIGSLYEESSEEQPLSNRPGVQDIAILSARF